MSAEATGSLAEDSPARLLGSLARTRFTGALRVEQDGLDTAVFLRDGAVVDADSAAPEDAFGRLLLEAGMIDAAAVGESIRRLALDPRRRPVDILVDLGALTAADAPRASQHVVARRTLRVFSLQEAGYRVDPADHARAGVGLGVPWLVHRGLRLHYDDRRLERELAPLSGQAITLPGDILAVHEAYGLGDEERILLAYLGKGYWELPDLVDACISVPRPALLTAVAALAALGDLDVKPAEAVPRLRKRAREATVPLSRTGFVPSAGLPQPAPAIAPPAPRAPSIAPPPPPPPPAPAAPAIVVAPAPAIVAPAPAPAAPTPSSVVTFSAPAAPRPSAPAPAPAPAVPVAGASAQRELILSKYTQIVSDVDHFAVLEVDRAATKEQVKAAYFQLAKTFHPDRLAILKLEDLRPQVERIFARLSEAFAALGDDARRKEYLKILAEGGEAAVKRREDAQVEQAVRILSAEESFRIGEMALRRQQFAQAKEAFKKALDGNPEEPEHHALYAWASFCAAPDKDRAGPEAKKSLQKAIEMSAKCVPAYLYLGMIHRQLGDIDKALGAFRKVLELRPGQVEAEREVRLLEMRKRGGGGGPAAEKKGGGFLDRFRKK